MYNAIKKSILSLFLSFAVIVILIISINCFKTQNKKSGNSNYSLKAYKNTVALYNGDKIIEIYNNIVLNTLPEKDILAFKNGIDVSTPSQAETLLEDYES